MKDRTALWMIVSGAVGFSLFLIANFTDIFYGIDAAAGILQLLVNLFVFVSWSKGYRTSSGVKKFVALMGTMVPVMMATITIYRVLFPFLGF